MNCFQILSWASGANGTLFHYSHHFLFCHEFDRRQNVLMGDSCYFIKNPVKNRDVHSMYIHTVLYRCTVFLAQQLYLNCEGIAV